MFFTYCREAAKVFTDLHVKMHKNAVYLSISRKDLYTLRASDHNFSVAQKSSLRAMGTNEPFEII